MKLSSSTLCGCCFCCYCHCWLMMLLMVSSVVHVSPEMPETTTSKIYKQFYNNNYAYQSEMSEVLHLNRKILNSRNLRTAATASTFLIVPKLPPSLSLPLSPPQPQPTPSTTTTKPSSRTTDNCYQQNTINSYPTFEQEAITTVATMQTKSAISTTKVATQAKAMTFIPATEQLQVTKQLQIYDTADSHTAALKAKRKIREKSKVKEQEMMFNQINNNSLKEEAAVSRTSMTNNYVADNKKRKPFVRLATIGEIKKQANDYGSNITKGKNENHYENNKSGSASIDWKPNQKHKLQQQQQQQHYDSITNTNSKLQTSKRSNEFRNISNLSSTIQKTTDELSLKHTNNKYGKTNINNNSTRISMPATKTDAQKQQQQQQKYLKKRIKNETRTRKATATAFDAATQLATAINSLPSNGTTDFNENSSHYLRNHNRNNNNNNNYYNYIGTSTDSSVSNVRPKEINQFSNDFYHLQKRKSIQSTAASSSSITTLQLRTSNMPSSYLTMHQHHLKRPAVLHRHGRQAATEDEQNEKCRMFIEGDPEKNELYSPEYPNEYPKNINCTRVITAPKGQIIRLDFRNSFHIEEKEECKFDFLEIRDGQYGFSNQIGKYCGTDFPPEITSRERYLWLHFHSDESIEYSGFTAVYEFIDRNRDAPSTDLNCTIDKDGFEGFVNATDVPTEIRDTVVRNKIPLDCMWRVQVQEKWKIQVKFVDFKLAKPNDCETNFLDIFPEQTVMPLRVKNFCGSAGEGITSDSNILHMRFYAEPSAINSTFSILYTAFRERGSSSCAEEEYDCEDATCIAADLKCNGRSNCKFLWDEEGCEEEEDGQSEHMIIIITVFGLILGGMIITFLVNCIRTIMQDQKIIREHIKQSKESKLDEMGRNSKARSRENISIVSPRQKHSQTSLQILDDVSNRYYREMELQTVKNNFKEKDPSILRHDMIVQTSLCNTDDSSTTITDQQQPITAPAGVNACDMGCQTRESLFATASLMRQESKTPSLAGSQRTIEGVPPPPRFSTFGYDAAQIAPPPPPTVSTLSRRNMHLPQASLEMEQLPQQTAHTMMMMPHQQQQQQQQQHQHLHYRPSQEICHHHHQHQQHLQQQQQKQTLPRHHAQQQQQPQHHQHMQHHHYTSAATIPPNVTQLPTPGTAVVTAVSTATSGRHREQSNINAANKNKQTKVDESKVFIDIRNSAPDVIIMTSH